MEQQIQRERDKSPGRLLTARGRGEGNDQGQVAESQQDVERQASIGGHEPQLLSALS
jgi:hypothetical protein